MNRVPRDIETRFRQSLGAIGPLMCLADLASKEIMKIDSNKLKQLVKDYKHRKLDISRLDLNDVSLYVNVAHIAYINSRAESFCNEVVAFNKVETENRINRNLLKTNLNGRSNKGSVVDEKSYNIDSVDFLRKAVFLVHARNNNLKSNTKRLDESIYVEYLGQEELLVIDYYRKLRNVEFHGGVSCDVDVQMFDEEQRQKILKKFNFCPNEFKRLSVRDVILYSQAWQSAAVMLCSKVVEIDAELLERIKKKYKNANVERKNNALRRKLSQDYLQSEDFISKLENRDWVA